MTGGGASANVLAKPHEGRLDAHGPVPFSAFVGLGKKLSGKEVQGIQSEYGSFSHIDQSDTITAVLIGHHDD